MIATRSIRNGDVLEQEKVGVSYAIADSILPPRPAKKQRSLTNDILKLKSSEWVLKARMAFKHAPETLAEADSLLHYAKFSVDKELTQVPTQVDKSD